MFQLPVPCGNKGFDLFLIKRHQRGLLKPAQLIGLPNIRINTAGDQITMPVILGRKGINDAHNGFSLTFRDFVQPIQQKQTGDLFVE